MVSSNTPALGIGGGKFAPVASSLIIADLQSHATGGHFSIWLNRTVKESLKHFGRLSVYVADEGSVPDLAFLDSRDRERISIVLIPKIYREKRFAGDILEVISRHHETETNDAHCAPLFLMWAQQYLERNLIFPPLKSWLPWKQNLRFARSWGSLSSISSVVHEESTAPMMEKRIHDFVTSHPPCEAVFLWDEYGVRKFGSKYIYLPNVEPLGSDFDWEMPRVGPVTIGSVGQLWGYRSMNLLAEIMNSDQDLKGYAGGVLRWNSYAPDTILLLSRDNGRFLLEEGFVESDSALNQRLQKLDAFVLDSRSYKCPSGLGIRAMSMGRPIIAVDSPSWIATLIKEEGVGILWQAEEVRLTEKLRDWYASGGSKRSKEAARRLSDQRGLERAYATMFERLTKAVKH